MNALAPHAPPAVDQSILSTDPDALAALARRIRGRAEAATRDAVYAAKLAGLYAGKRGAPAEDCPFAEPEMRDAWLSYRIIGARAVAEARAAATADLLGALPVQQGTST